MRQNIFRTVFIAFLTFLLYPSFCATGNPQSSKQEKKEKTINVNGVDIILVHIPAGEYLMGSPETESFRQSDEGPQHKIKMKHGLKREMTIPSNGSHGIGQRISSRV
jgi:hypothetical protein